MPQTTFRLTSSFDRWAKQQLKGEGVQRPSAQAIRLRSEQLATAAREMKVGGAKTSQGAHTTRPGVGRKAARELEEGCAAVVERPEGHFTGGTPEERKRDQLLGQVFFPAANGITLSNLPAERMLSILAKNGYAAGAHVGGPTEGVAYAEWAIGQLMNLAATRDPLVGQLRTHVMRGYTGGFDFAKEYPPMQRENGRVLTAARREAKEPKLDEVTYFTLALNNAGHHRAGQPAVVVFADETGRYTHASGQLATLPLASHDAPLLAGDPRPSGRAIKVYTTKPEVPSGRVEW